MATERFTVILCMALFVACCLARAARAAGASGPAGAAEATGFGPNVEVRGGLANCRIQFERAGKGHVAFMGGSITEMNGYRPLVCEALKKRFPKTEFAFTDAGIASTCSTTGAFRLAGDVLAAGPVDLLLVEYAVNDDQDAAHAARECLRGMEGIIRRLRLHNPAADVAIVYFVNPEMLKTIQDGNTPVPMAAHEHVARHYNAPSIHLAREVARRIADKRMTWEQYGGTHPGKAGNALAAEMVEALMAAARKDPMPAGARKAPYPLPERPLDERSYFRGRFIHPKEAQVKAGWMLGVPAWKQLAGACRGRFLDTPLLCADKPGAELTLVFEGTAVGAYVLAGPDAGIVEAAIDGGPPRAVDLYHRFSRGLHYPRTVMFAADLAGGRHTLTLRLTGEKSPGSTGTAGRILQFAAN